MDLSNLEQEFARNRIEQLRKSQSGLSERKLSSAMGYSDNYINQIMSGKNNVSLETIKAVCKYFGITALEFFDPEYKNPMLAKELNKELNRISGGDYSEFIKIIKAMDPEGYKGIISLFKNYKNSK